MFSAVVEVVQRVLRLQAEPDENRYIQTQREINDKLAILYIAQGTKYSIRRLLGIAIEFYEISLCLNPKNMGLHKRLEQFYYMLGLNT